MSMATFGHRKNRVHVWRTYMANDAPPCWALITSPPHLPGSAGALKNAAETDRTAGKRSFHPHSGVRELRCWTKAVLRGRDASVGIFQGGAVIHFDHAVARP